MNGKTPTSQLTTLTSHLSTQLKLSTGNRHPERSEGSHSCHGALGIRSHIFSYSDKEHAGKRAS